MSNIPTAGIALSLSSTWFHVHLTLCRQKLRREHNMIVLLERRVVNIYNSLVTPDSLLLSFPLWSSVALDKRQHASNKTYSTGMFTLQSASTVCPLQTTTHTHGVAVLQNGEIPLRIKRWLHREGAQLKKDQNTKYWLLLRTTSI